VKELNGNLLAIDPGKRTGVALIDIQSEKVLIAGSVKRNVSGSSCIQGAYYLGWKPGLLAIEQQYLGKNPQTFRKLIQLAESEKSDWLIYYGGENTIIEVHPKSWQAALKIPVRATRKHVKEISLKMALLEKPDLVDQDAADTINMGLYAARHLKESMLKQLEKR